MTRPDPNPETGGRPLAEILREAGIDMSRSARRRRWNDPAWDDPVPQRRRDHDADADRDTDTDTGAQLRRRRSDLQAPETPGRGLRTARAAEPSTAAIPNMRPTAKPHVPTPPPTSTPAPAAGPAPVAGSAPAPSRTPRPARTDRSRPAEPEPPASATTRTGTRTAGTRTEPRTGRRADRPDEEPSTGPIPIAAADLSADEEIGGRESALAWLRFGGELLIALAVGVGVFFAFTVLWEMLPYVAVLAAPVVVAGLVGGVAMWRTRLGREQIGVRLLAVLVFAGTLLAIAPAAGLLSGH